MLTFSSVPLSVFLQHSPEVQQRHQRRSKILIFSKEILMKNVSMERIVNIAKKKNLSLKWLLIYFFDFIEFLYYVPIVLLNT